jgi:ABC-type Co2+ transport system permease subunit
MDLASIREWFFGLGQQYGVNPIIFGAIYVGAIPFFTGSIAWLVRNFRRKKSIVVPTLVAGFFFVSAYLYLIVVGNNVPLWVYGLVVAMIVFGATSTAKKVKARVQEGVNEA